MKNYTPHVINFVDANGNSLFNLEPTGVVPRVEFEEEEALVAEGIPVFTTQARRVIDLPRPCGEWIIVSRVVAAQCRDRGDLLIPGSLVRDEAGRVIGCRRLDSLAWTGPHTRTLWRPTI